MVKKKKTKSKKTKKLRKPKKTKKIKKEVFVEPPELPKQKSEEKTSKKPVKKPKKDAWIESPKLSREEPKEKPKPKAKPKKTKPKSSKSEEANKKIEAKPLELTDERDIALDFASKVYKKFSKIIKSIILFGSSTKKTATPGSDIDLIIIVDDATIIWDQELIAWYREELGKIIASKKYIKPLHVNTTKITTWWTDLLRGDPVIINILRYGESIIDFGGFFNPLKILLQQGKIKSTPEAIFTSLQRAPAHLARSKAAEIGAVEGVYWSFVDAAHAALIAAKKTPPSPEHIPIMLKETFVDNKLLKMKYVIWYKDIFDLYKKVSHGKVKEISGTEIDVSQERAETFMGIMAELVKRIAITDDDKNEKKD